MSDCAHLMCRDQARSWVSKTRGLCRAHYLEHKHLQHVARQRARYQPRQRWVQPCGTPAAAARHRRRKEPVCDPCRIADNARTAAWKEKKRGQV